MGIIKDLVLHYQTEYEKEKQAPEYKRNELKRQMTKIENIVKIFKVQESSKIKLRELWKNLKKEYDTLKG